MADAAVVGLGRVGSRNDDVADAEPLSHVGAVLATPGIRLVAMVDSDRHARAAAAARWRDATDAAILASMDDIAPGSVDVVALCTPTARRAEQVAAALALRPRVLIVEKPLAADLVAARSLVRRAAAADVTLRVNYNRRFDPATRAFRDWFSGTPAKAVLRYGKGLHNYASHMVDLLLDWFGPATAVQALGPAGRGDPNLDFRCRMAAGFDALFVGVDGLGYDQFEIELLFPDRRLEYAAGGALRRLWRPREDVFYRGYAHVPAEAEETETGRVGGFRELYAAVRDHLNMGAPLAGCDGDAAVAGLAVLDAALRSARDGGRRRRLRQRRGGERERRAA